MHNGIYLIADTPRTAIPLATESNGDDENLLFEALEDAGYDTSGLERKEESRE